MPQRPDRVAYWAEIFLRWQQSGLSKAEFCRQAGLSLASFKNWLYTPTYRRAIDRFVADSDRPGPQSGSRGPRLVPVVVRADDGLPDDPLPTPSSEPSLQVVLGVGRRIAVGPGFDPDTLRRLIDALEARP
jgi:hypothetical protein